jgi:SAM-dependent methyltransferase
MTHEESSYIQQQRQKEIEFRQAEMQIDSAGKYVLSLPDDLLPPVWMMQKIGSHSIDHFKNTAVWTFGDLVRRGRVGSSSRIIDIGSGCGRMALPFTQIIKTGRYFGTDVFVDGINWCKSNISNAHPCFQFELQTVMNNYYFGGDVKPSDEISLSFADSGSIDFVFAISVFTHLVEQDAQRYLNEIARCLTPDGVAYLTCFIIDDPFHNYVRSTNKHTAVQRVSGGHFQAYSGQDFFAGYEMPHWQHMNRKAGLEVYGFDPGTWADKPGGRHYQDSFIITKKH